MKTPPDMFVWLELLNILGYETMKIAFSIAVGVALLWQGHGSAEHVHAAEINFE